jgi:hypothetical protein
MIKTTLLCGAVLAAIPLLTSAKDFPLEFKTLTAEEAMSLPGGGSGAGSLQLEKPGAITKAPKAVSKYPLYGQLSGANRLWFRIDESKGNGKGYDTLILDLNQNGDLTDDPVALRVDKPAPVISSTSERSVFGPIAVPEGKKIGAWQPVYYARMNLYNLADRIKSGSRANSPGQLSLRSGWCAETTVEMDGVTRKVGIVDGNCSFRLGDTSKPYTYTNQDEVSWYFSGGDSFLVDNDGSGKFRSSIDNTESAPFGPLLYLGAKPYSAVLAADSKTLALEPFKGPLAELALQPHGEQVSEIEVAWENAPGQWQELQLGVANGKASVPPGNYRLLSCSLLVKTADGETLILSGYKRSPEKTTAAAAGAATPFKCGSPLEFKVTSERDTRSSGANMAESVARMGKGLAEPEQSPQQLIRAYALGAGGETYGNFMVKNSQGKMHKPPNPVFVIATTDGKEVASGNMEFG